MGLMKVDACIDMICSILDDFGVRYARNWSYPTPYGRTKFDVACFSENAEYPGLIVEVDGLIAYDDAFYRYQGSRPCRNHIHVLKGMRTQALKRRLAVQHGAPVLYFSYEDALNPGYVRETLAVYLDVFVDKSNAMSPEVGCAKMLERYFPDMTYVSPSGRLSREEMAYLEQRRRDGKTYVSCDGAPCMHGGACPYGLLSKLAN